MENKLQAQCVEWLWNTYPLTRGLFFHIPNGGKRTKLEAMRFKAMGVLAGVPDLCLAIPIDNSGALYVEMKIGTGKTSEAQERIHKALELAGNKVAVIYDFETFKALIESYLQNTIYAKRDK